MGTRSIPYSVALQNLMEIARGNTRWDSDLGQANAAVQMLCRALEAPNGTARQLVFAEWGIPDELITFPEPDRKPRSKLEKELAGV